ncbi:alkylation response protein AidB-like acyl-CoA dehydrogenase [Actinomycetospora succinea]|uniref:Alkylation response protein AidB-like acyl-CoA dehydrogenase n=1 Tax=Actinomycetospora succinea TaxID=663603 RepID=A0A4R6V9L8_9PSEU|nr:acyl-CoA dehydrogenase family protein [Actinomycetospora succinea]TDQ58305.1 alkylation response protein AidB-like acyl-CoA dehydrogenase [Actinomycetospora succinea]
MSAPATPETGDLLYSDVEDDLRASVRALVEKQAPWDAVLRRTDTDDAVDTDLWKRLTQEIGVAGLAVPEERGGAGASWREVAVVAEELGRAVAPVPFLGTAVATALLLGTAEDELLASVAGGERTAVLVVGATRGAGRPVPVVERQGAGDLLAGTVTAVVDAVTADVLLVPVSATEIAVVEAGADGGGDGVTRTTSESLDMTRRLTDVTFDGAPARIVTGADVDHALQVGAAVLASEQLGLAERCLADTVAYLRDRHQFGRQLASYQALKHRLADLWVAITQARAVARYAARCAADGSPDLPVAAAVAQTHCSEVALLAAEDGLQLHGGIGFTWEHPAHLFLKRARADALVLGSADHHRTVLADLVDLPA